MTNHPGGAAVAENAREYIFKKSGLSYEAICTHPMYGPGGSKWADKERNYFLKRLDTDPESSDYESAEETAAAPTPTASALVGAGMFSVGGSSGSGYGAHASHTP